MIALSSVRRLKNAKHSVAAAGIMFQNCTITVTESIIPPQMMQKSLTDQNHSFTLALRFSG